jgi:hypothetical protein
MSKPERNSTDIGAFAQAVGHHWITLMGGGVITVAVGVFERVSGKNVPLWVYGCILVFFAFLACYLAWRDERRAREEQFTTYQSEKSRQDDLIRKLENQESQKARRRHLRERLGELLIEGDQISWGMVSQRSGVHSQHIQWITKVKEFLSNEPEFDNSHLARFDAIQLRAIDQFIKEFN